MLHSFCLFHKKRNGTANGMRNVYCIGVGFSRRSTMPDTTKNRSFLWGQFDRTVKTCGNKVLPDVPGIQHTFVHNACEPVTVFFHKVDWWPVSTKERKKQTNTHTKRKSDGIQREVPAFHHTNTNNTIRQRSSR